MSALVQPISQHVPLCPAGDHLMAEYASFALPKAGEELCGDSIQALCRDGSTIAVLADGLGSGVKANILSTMTARIAATLFEKGLSLDAVVETVSSTLPVCRVRKLAYSTFTIVEVEPSGRAYLAEFDNPPALLLRDGELVEIERQRRSIAGRAVTEASVQLQEGDLIVVVSDGVVHAGIGGLVPLGWRWENLAGFLSRNSVQVETALALVRRLEKTCLHLYEEQPGDDTSAIAMMLRRPSTLTLVVGPPVDPADDGHVARLLREARGLKVVCGGTTANLIAREWGVPLRVDLDHMEPDAPPLGYMKGANLVTEGIITVSQALELVKLGGALRGEQGVPACLARMLLASDDIHLVVGRAINPAHQNPGLGGRLALKFQVIDELRRELMAQGKNVRMTCF